MCGIVGVVDAEESPGLIEDVRRATQLLRHRGPDDEGLHTIRGSGRNGAHFTVVLAHRRLSIIDLSAAARQPMTLGDTGLVVSFNGEIYNYRELRSELQSAGIHFATCSDTEVLLAAWWRWGPACLNRFVGMFALAILDTRANKLFLARDPFGIKPLFYARPAGRLIFASEIPALLEMPGVRRRTNPQRVFDHLNDGVADHGSETFFADVRQLPPAHYMEVSLESPGEAEPIRYWDLDCERRENLSFPKAAGRLRELFIESVSLHLRSDVPLGVALSGGIDSSAVIAASRRLIGASGELHSFSYIPADPTISEERWVDSANQSADAIAHKVSISAADFRADFDAFTCLQGEPVPGPVAYAQWKVFEQCRRSGVKVLLEGQGADELLAGYPIYPPARLDSLVRKGQWLSAVQFSHAVGSSRREQWRMLRSASSRLLRHQPRRESDVFPWISRRWLNEHGLALRQPPSSRSRFQLRRALYETLFVTRIPAYLRWGDRSAMACSIENRVPFLTTHLAEFLFSLPEQYLLAQDGLTKSVFREAMRGLVPVGILARRDKVGFATPYRSWLEGLRPLCADLLDYAERIPALDYSRVRQDCAGFLSGNQAPLPVLHHLWGLVFLAAWARHFNVCFD